MYLPYTTEKVAGEEGLISCLLDEALDQKEYDVNEGEESKEEEEDQQL